MKVAVLGCGNMSQAIVKGMAKHFDINFHTYTPSFTRAEVLATEVNGQAYKKISDIPACDLYLVACKPQQFSDLAKELAPCLPKDKEALLVSILAGTTVATIKAALNASKVIRIMPNTPTLVGAGVNALYFSKEVTSEETEQMSQLFSSFSKVFIFNDEDQIDRITPVSGSGPAYVFELARILTKKMQDMGITSKTAKLMVAETLYGSAKLLRESDDDAETLRNNVTSKKGVTYEALEVFKKNNLEATVNDAIDAAYKRAKELAEE